MVVALEAAVVPVVLEPAQDLVLLPEPITQLQLAVAVLLVRAVIRMARVLTGLIPYSAQLLAQAVVVAELMVLAVVAPEVLVALVAAAASERLPLEDRAEQEIRLQFHHLKEMLAETQEIVIRRVEELIMVAAAVAARQQRAETLILTQVAQVVMARLHLFLAAASRMPVVEEAVQLVRRE